MSSSSSRKLAPDNRDTVSAGLGNAFMIAWGLALLSLIIAFIVVAAGDFPLVAIGLGWISLIAVVGLAVYLTSPRLAVRVKSFLLEEFNRDYHLHEDGHNDGYGASYPLPIFEQAESQIDIE